MSHASSKYRALGPVCRTYRNSAGLSQADIAQHLGYESPQLISNFERGLCSLPVKKLFEYAGLSKMPEAVLVGVFLSENLYQMAESLESEDFKGRIFKD